MNLKIPSCHGVRLPGRGSDHFLKILSVSDTILDFIYNPSITTRFADVDVVIGCGDLPYYYLEYIISKLDKPTFFVRGNHAHAMEYSDELGPRSEPHGGIDLHRQVISYHGLLMAGVQGSLRYRAGPYQYSQGEMLGFILEMVPKLLLNRVLYGRFLDIFVTHAPPAGIHDESDLPHRGIKAFRWFISVFQPAFHFHGHIHVYRTDKVVETQLGSTTVINSYGYRESYFEIPRRRGF